MLSSSIAALALLAGPTLLPGATAQTLQGIGVKSNLTLSTPTKPINVSISNNSPLLTYRPNATQPGSGSPGLPAEAWNTTWSESSWSSWQPNALGSGKSAHVTSNNTAYVYFSFVGTQIHFLGKCPGCNLTLFVDLDSYFGLTNELGDEEGVIASSPVLPFSFHTASLSIKEGSVELTSLQYTTELPTYSNVANETEVVRLDATVPRGSSLEANNDKIQSSETSSGRVWGTNATLGVQGNTTPYPRIATSAANANANFYSPPGASMVTLYGSMNHDHGPYTIEVMPEPPGMTRGARWYYGYSPWATKDAVLFSTVLDPTRTYTVRMVNMFEGKSFDFSHADFYVTNTTDPNPSPGGAGEVQDTGAKKGGGGGLSGGAIAGIVVGAVAGLALLLLLAWFLFRHRRAERRPRAILDDIDGMQDSRDTGSKPEISPYIMPGVEIEPKTAANAPDAAARPGQQLNPSDESIAYIAEEDAGPAPGYERERVQRVPPSYDPRWSEQVLAAPPQGSPEEYEGDDYVQARNDSVQLSSEGRPSVDEKARRQSSTPSAPSARRQSSALTVGSLPSEKRRHSSRTSEMDDRRVSDTPSTIRRNRSTAKPPLVLAEMQRAMSGDQSAPQTSPTQLPDRKLSDKTDEGEHAGSLHRKGSTYKPPIALQSMSKVSEERLNMVEEPPQIDPLDASASPPTPPPRSTEHQ